MDRRHFCAAVVGAAAASLTTGSSALDVSNAFAFRFPGIDGKDIDLSAYQGQVLLVVNTASQCGFTNQYGGLQKLWTTHRERGLTVVGVPSNDFGGQEPGDETEILGFCTSVFGVTFPLTGKTVVRGPSAHPFYRWAAQSDPDAVPRWNFHKLLIARNGTLSNVFPTAIEPTDRRITNALQLALSAKT